MRVFFLLLSLVTTGILYVSLTAQTQGMDVSSTIQTQKPDDAQLATFAGGCFWCIESEFRALEGVLYTRVGYEGGDLKSPSYKDITTGQTGHAEVLQVYFNPQTISYETLVTFFLKEAHDPTQINRQGVDVGTQYRSAIFYHDETQQQTAKSVISAINEEGIYQNPIATKVSPSQEFWEAEEYHQQYYEKYEEKHGKPHIRVILKKAKK